MIKYIFYILVFFLPMEAFASWSVWTESMLADKPQPSYNPASKLSSIELKGAKNEWVGFLLCVRGDETLNGFTPSVAATLTSETGSTIANNNIIPYILFNHTTTERANTYEVPGTYPDAAVPYRDVYFNEVRNGTEAGWGQTVTANITRVFFVEIYIPSVTVAGEYTGTFRMSSNNGALTKDIPITLNVWDFTLPEQWSLKNVWGVDGQYARLDGTAFGARDDSKAREYLFNMQKSAINHGFFLYGEVGRQVSGPHYSTNSFVDPYFDGANDAYSWKRFLDGTVPQGYNPKPYPKTSAWVTRDDIGVPLIHKSTTTMDAWATWIDSNGYRANTLFFDKILDEPSLSDINLKHSDYILRHAGHPERPMEFWTAGNSSYPPLSSFWADDFKSMWMVSQMYPWYRADDGNVALGSPDDFSARIDQYGDLLFSYTAGDNDRDCNRDMSSNIGDNCRAAASSSIDAYSRQNAYMFISDWHFKTKGHHFWATNGGWGRYVGTTTANGNGDFFIPVTSTLPNGTFQVYAFWTAADGDTTTRLIGSGITVSSSSGVTTLTVPQTGGTVGPNITVAGTAIAGATVKVLITGTTGMDTANIAWETTDPFADDKMGRLGYGLNSSSGYNGDGVYFYPGRVSGTNYDIGGTHDIPIESYRMKLVRWGAQVYEYAKLLEDNGRKATADTQIARMVTFNSPNTITVAPVSDWESARDTMGSGVILQQKVFRYLRIKTNGNLLRVEQ